MHTFREVRQILLSLATYWDRAQKVFAMKDDDEKWSVVVRIVDVLSIGVKCAGRRLPVGAHNV